MPLIFAMPSGISDELEQTLAAIQTQFNAAVAGLGKRIDVPYAARNFSAPASSAYTWTVNANSQIYYYYAFLGELLLISFRIQTTMVTGNPDLLQLTGITGLNVAPQIEGSTLGYAFPAYVDRDLDIGEAGIMRVFNGGTGIAISVQQADRGVFTNTGWTTVAGLAIVPYVRV